jgi:putative CocE/NonD family hydrolase
MRLDMDIYRPDNHLEYPILLMRQPYGREIASTVVYAHPLWYAAQGYIVVIQDVRGRGTSEGEFTLFGWEKEDGWDTLDWLSQLPGSTGEVGMYGFSYQGMTQLYAAASQHPALKTICPSMVAYNLYTDWAYENGAFCLQTNLAWGLQLAAETARRKGDDKAFTRLYQAARNLPLNESIPAYPQILAELAPDSFYGDWLTYPPEHSYWRELSPESFLDRLDLPMLHIGGWFDPYLRGNLGLYQGMCKRSTHRQNLIIGPWTHLPWGKNVGSQDYGKAAISPIDNLQIKWFNYFLKGQQEALLNIPNISLFEIGSNHWKALTELPKYEQKIYYLNSTGLAAIREDDGRLEEVYSSDFNDILVHDPWRPVPSLGGHAALPGGSWERSSLDNRSDILTYTSSPLGKDLDILGVVEVEMYGLASTSNFDLCVILSIVEPTGKVYNFTQGYKRFSHPQIPWHLTLQFTCIKISAGHSLRLSLSGACFPAYPVNCGTGKALKESRLMEAQVITLQVQARSRIILPVN